MDDLTINETIYHLKQEDPTLTWDEVGEAVGLNGEATRKRYGRYESSRQAQEYFKQTGENSAESSAIGYKALTVEDHIKIFNIDTKIWQIERPLTNTWPVAMKLTEKDLTYDDGKASGTIKSDGMPTVVTLHQLKVFWRRIEPIAIRPVLHLIKSADFKILKKPTPKKTGVGHALILADPQFGFWKQSIHYDGGLIPMHSRESLDIAHQVAAYHIDNYGKFDVIVWLGDIGDFSAWSTKFIKHPNFLMTTQPAIIEGHWWLRQFASLGSPCKILSGNHDIRPETLLKLHILDAYDLHAADNLGGYPLMSVPNMFGMADLGIEYIEDYPDGQVWLNGGFACEHGDVARAGSGATTANLAKERNHSTIVGHIHKIERATKTWWTRGDDGGKKAVITRQFSPGCLCTLDNVPAKKSRQNWQQGMAIVAFERGMNKMGFQCNLIDMVNDQAFYMGKLFKARNQNNKLDKYLQESLRKIK